MSREERRKKLKEEGIIEINSNSYNNIVNRSREMQKNASQYNSKLPTSVKSQVDNLYNKNNVQKNDMWERVKARAQNIMNSTNYISQKFSEGIISGVTGIGQSGITEFANNLKIGNEKKSNEIIQDVFSRFDSTINPTKMYTSLMKKTIEDNVNILKNKDTNTLEKGVNTVTQTVSNAINSLPIKKQIDTVQQVVGKIANENASKEMLKLNEKISEPSEKINQMLAEESKKHGTITNYIGDAMQSVGNMGVSIGTTAITGNPAIGLGVMGISSKGQSTQEALNKGMNLQDAINIGNTKGAIEIGTEMLTGGVNILGKGALDEIVEKGINKKIVNKVLNGLAHYGYDIVGEVTEETISDLLGTIIDKGTVDPNATYGVKDFADTAITTMLSTTILNLLTGGLASGNNTQKSGSQQTTIENEQVLKNNQQVTQEQGKSTQIQTSNQIEEINQNQEKLEKVLQKDKYRDNKNAKNFFESANKNNLDISNEKMEALFDLPNLRGVKTEFNQELFKDQNGNLKENVNAVYVTDSDGNRSIIYNPNVNQESIVEKNVIHETFHDMIGTKETQEITDFVFNKMKDNTEFQEAFNSLKETYSHVRDNEGRILYNAESVEFENMIKEEVVADYLGQNLGTQEYINELVNGKESRNIAQKIYDAIVKFLDKVTGYKTEEAYLRGLKDKFEKAFNSEYSNNNEQTKYSIAGKKAMENAINKDSQYKIIEESYNKALKMAKENVDNEQIRQKTNWFQDKNGDWKFEFSDKDMSLKNIYFEENKNYKLDDILEHETLFLLYPELRKLEVKFEKKKNGNAAYYHNENLITINTNFGNSKIAIEGSLIHEIQHAIQHIEKFEVGTSIKKGIKKYYNSLGEIEASDTKRRFIKEQEEKFDRESIPPESSKQNPVHPNIKKNQNIIEKIKDSIYNYFNSEKGENDYEKFQKNDKQNKNENPLVVDGRRHIDKNIQEGLEKDINKNISRELENNSSSFSLPKNPNILTNTKGKQINISELKETTQMKLNTYNRKYNKENITAYRGISEETGSNAAMYGLGLYTTLDKSYAKKFGNVEIVDNNLLPDNPLKFRTQNDFQMWEQDLASQLGIKYSELLGSDYGIEKYVKKLGYDGLMIGTGKDTDLISFKDNSNKKLSQETKGKWQEFLDKNTINNGTRTTLGELKKLPQKKEIKLPQKENKSIISNTNNNKVILPESKKIDSNRTEIPTNPTIYQDEDVRAFKYATDNIDNISQENNFTPPKLSNDDLPNTKAYISKKRTKSKTKPSEILDSFKQSFVNKGHYIDKLSKQTKNNELKYKYDRTLSTFNEAQYSIGNEQINSKGEVVGESLLDIFKPIEEAKLETDFEDYLLNKHNIARTIVGKSIYGDDVSAPQSKKNIENYEKKYPQFKEWSEKVNKYNQNTLKDMADTGMISKETYSNLRTMYGDYVPTYRDIVDEKVIFDEDNNVGSNALGKATKSNLEILSPKEAMAEQTLAVKKAIRVNELGIELYKTLGKNSKVFEGIDFDATAIQTLGGDVIQKAQDGMNTFTIFINGKSTQFKISDELYTAFSKDTLQSRIQNNKALDAILTPVEKLSKTQRNLLTTYSIGFAFNNPIKDIQDAVFNTKYSVPRFSKNYVKALYQIGIKGNLYKQYLRDGGSSNTYFEYNKGLLPQKNKIRNIIDKVQVLNETLEIAPRLAEYMSTLEEGGTKSEAMYNAAEITTNFKRGGDITKAINKYGANFLNASVQGLDKQIRNITGENCIKGYASLIARTALLGILPSVLNHLILDDDNEYQDLPDYIKDSYYLIPSSKEEDKFIRIPKGRVLASIGTVARNMLELSEDERNVERAITGSIEGIMNNLAPNNPLTDHLVAPILQAKDNKAWYDGEIESSRLQKLPVAERTDEKTDELSNKLSEMLQSNSLTKYIADKLGISPKKLNYVIDQYSGGIGDILLPIVTPYAENNILEDKFTTSSTLKNKNVETFYTALENAELSNNSEYATDTDKLEYKYLSSISKDVRELYSQKRNIQNSNLSDNEKKTQTKEIQLQINNIVKEALNTLENATITSTMAKFNEVQYYKDGEGKWKEIKDVDIPKGLSTQTYADYKNKIAVETDNKRKRENDDDITLTSKEKINLLKTSTYKDKEKNQIYSEILGKNDKDYKYLSKLEDININAYLDYKIQEIKGDEDLSSDIVGKTKSGSKKNNLINYLNSSELSNLDKIYILGKSNKLTFEQGTMLENVVNNSNLTPEEKKEFYKGLASSNVEELKNGNIRIKWSK